MSSETQVAKHYTRGRLEETILRALAESGKDPETLTPLDLAPVDEFHVGGLASTQELAARMELHLNYTCLTSAVASVVPPATLPRNTLAG